MSLVGPRPLVTDEDAQVLGMDRSRLHLTPGMTGPWQILGARVPMQEMVGIDYLYVASWSLWLDVKLLMRTVATSRAAATCSAGYAASWPGAGSCGEPPTMNPRSAATNSSVA